MNALYMILGMALGWFLKWTIWDSGMVRDAWRFCVNKDARIARAIPPRKKK